MPQVVNNTLMNYVLCLCFPQLQESSTPRISILNLVHIDIDPSSQIVYIWSMQIRQKKEEMNDTFFWQIEYTWNWQWNSALVVSHSKRWATEIADVYKLWLLHLLCNTFYCFLCLLVSLLRDLWEDSNLFERIISKLIKRKHDQCNIREKGINNRREYTHLYLCNISTPFIVCTGWKKNNLCLSFLNTNCTEWLQKLHTPSKRTINLMFILEISKEIKK